MGSSAAPMPKYRKPPVMEVAISVQFDELAGFQPVHFGLLWERIRDRYPHTEHHPPLPSIVELFEGSGSQRATLTFDAGFPVGRCWYLTDDNLRLIQVQPDRFILNWRKLDTDIEYPSYDTLRDEFSEELGLLEAFIRDNELGDFQPTQCEVTYVNHIPQGQGWQRRADLSNVLTTWTGATSEGSLPEAEDARLAWQYRLGESSPLGRLHVQLQSATRKRDGIPIFALQLTARGTPTNEGIRGVLEFNDLAHEWIVRGFTAITTAQMHELWERYQ